MRLYNGKYLKQNTQLFKMKCIEALHCDQSKIQNPKHTMLVTKCAKLFRVNFAFDGLLQ